MAEPDTSELTPAEENDYYKIAKQGKDTWNRWVREYLTSEQIDDSGLSHLDNLTENEKAELAAKLDVIDLPNPADAYFENLKFTDPVRFSGYVFIEVYFDKVVFESVVYFRDSVFLDAVGFGKCSFERSVNFLRAKFFAGVDFDECKFNRIFSFGDVYTSEVNFNDVVFNSSAFFWRADFQGPADFTDSLFEEKAIFNSTKFSSLVSFSGVSFREAPEFHDASLPQNTSFYGATFNLSKSDSLRLWNGRARAWRTLKQKMHSFQSYQEELNFFARELDARARSEANTIFVWMVACYSWLCGFGTLIRRPAYILLAVWATSSFFYYLFMKSPSAISAASISFSNTIPFVGQSRLIADVALKSFSQDSYALVYAFSVGQGLLSAILLFLILLGIRNHFRLK
ncbi:MAG: pentapeptide repeat-containing protein [Rhodospirillaceae bacterium]